VGGGEQELAQSMGINVVDVIEYSPNVYDANVIAARLAQDRPDFLWDVSYLDDGVAIWNAILNSHVTLKAAIGTSSAFCMPEFSRRLGAGSVGVYAADKPDADISQAALSQSGRALLARAQAAYDGATMDIPAVAGFVGGWTLFHDVLPNAGASISAESIRAAAVEVDVPVGDSINGGGVKFAGPGALDEERRPDPLSMVHGVDVDEAFDHVESALLPRQQPRPADDAGVIDRDQELGALAVHLPPGPGLFRIGRLGVDRGEGLVHRPVVEPHDGLQVVLGRRSQSVSLGRLRLRHPDHYASRP